MQEHLPEESSYVFEPLLPPWYQAAEGAGLERQLAARRLPPEILDSIVDAGFAALSSSFQNYQPRQEQIRMARKIMRSFYYQKTAVLEAGTGIGKSFAYLVPSLAYSYLTGERVLVATETKNLQMQLFEKDLPKVREILAPDLRYELCLGSGNYLCRLRYDETMLTGAFRDLISQANLDEFRGFAGRVFDGQQQGHYFETENLASSQFWSLVNRDSDGCPGSRCLHFSRCNYYRVKNAWAESRIMVGNHHLLLYHLLNDKKTLPAYGAVVLDEAHGVLKTGYSIFTLSFSADSLAEQKKVFDRVLRQLPAQGQEFVQECDELLKAGQTLWDEFFSRWEVALDLSFDENATKIVDGKNRLSLPLAGLVSTLESLRDLMKDLQENTEDSSALNGLKGMEKFYQKALQFVRQFDFTEAAEIVFWGEKRRGYFWLHCCNLNLGEQLSELMQESQLWTSATLGYWPFSQPARSVEEKVQKGYFKSFIEEAIPATPAKELVLDYYSSPFHYGEQAMLYIPTHLLVPEYNAPMAEKIRYEKMLTDEIIRLVELSGGGALVLFTANATLRSVTESLRERLELDVYSQLELGANEALQCFRNNENSVLLGSASFWQGVDVSGYGLRLLIITRLMFTPPDDPIFQARSRKLENQNRKPFFELSLPQASTMLRQAFGRLIRSETDKGVVAILDGRILQKTYGKTLLVNLPEVPLATDFKRLQENAKARNLFGKNRE